MQIIKFITLALVSSVMVSCASLNGGSSSFDDSESPYVAEETTPKVKEEPQPKQKIVVKEEKVTVVDQANAEVFKYYVIIGSFRVLENAKNYKQQLLSEGFMPVLLENENGLFRVSIAAYNDEMPARNKIDNIRIKHQKYNDVWLLIRKA